MQLKCNRFVFEYLSPAEEVEDFIRRSADFAEQTYGRDKYFSRLNQVLDHARFLGWGLPRFGSSELPEEFTEVPPAGIDHIFENQAKILVDVAPVTQVMLENGKYCPVRMICATTAAGDLIWKCHLLTDRDGCPYVQRKNQKLRVKTKGTKIVCQAETLPYDEKYLFECFGGEKTAIWPVPFLPEFFSDRPIAQIFRAEEDVVETVTIQEKTPVRVLVSELVPWYRSIQVDRTKALPLDDYEGAFDEDPVANEAPSAYSGYVEQSELDDEEVEEDPEEEDTSGFDVNTLVDGWDDLEENERISVDDFQDGDEDEEDLENELTTFINIAAPLSEKELSQLQEYDDILQKSGIASKHEAESLKEDPKHKERAEKWLVTAINRLRLLANFSKKLGCVLSLIQKHLGQQVLLIQPRQKWASSLVDILNQKGHKAQLFDPEKPQSQLRHFYDGSLRILVTSAPKEEMFIDDLIIISVSAFDLIKWFEWLNPTQMVYTVCAKQLGYSDHNCVPEHPMIAVDVEDYTGPGFEFLEIQEVTPQPQEIKQHDPVLVAEAPKAETPKPEKAPEKEKKDKFKVVMGKGRPKMLDSYEKALEFVKKQEEQGKKCEVYGPEGSEAVYITGIGELN